ncbi:adenylyl cyclase, partial [Rozella allomycis CSF55]
EKFGAVVMADVSGYSTLAAKLAERGQIGAEILSKTMNAFMEKAVQIVLSHGGDVIKFAGDAIVLCWRTESEDENERGEYVLQACECCLALLKKLSNFPTNIPDCDITHLNVHLGVGAGPMFDVHVGGPPGRWEHFIAGESINQLAIVLDLAKPGQLAVSHFALKYLSRVVEVASLQLGSYDKRCIILNALENKKRTRPKLEFPEETPLQDFTLEKCRLYQSYVSNAAVYRILSGGNDPLLVNEFRKISTIFIKIKSITFKTEHCLPNSQAAMNAIQTALSKYEGTLRQFIVDDKGSVILSYFGLPPFAHENDPMIALKAAIEIRNRLKPIFEDGFAIGVATGMVYCGLIGGVERADYTVTGDSVNMAARLMSNSLAKHEVLCDEETYQSSLNYLEFEAMGKIKVKGKVHPISVYKPVRSKKASVLGASSALPLQQEIDCGRDKEKEALKSAFSGMVSGKRKLIVVEEHTNQGIMDLGRFICEEATR